MASSLLAMAPTYYTLTFLLIDAIYILEEDITCY